MSATTIGLMNNGLAPEVRANLVGKVSQLLLDGNTDEWVLNELSGHLETKFGVSDSALEANQIVADAKVGASIPAPVAPVTSSDMVNVEQSDDEDDLVTVSENMLEQHSLEEITAHLVETYDGVTTDDAAEFIKEARTNHRPKTLLGWAFNAQHRGFFVFPCKQAGKRPAGEVVPNGVLDATNDPKSIRHWWSVNPNFNPAVALGPSNLVGYDYDSISPFPDLPPTLRIRSGRILKNGESGGYHDYYQGSCKTRSMWLGSDGKLLDKNHRQSDGTLVDVNEKDSDGKLIHEPVGEIRSRGAYLIWAGSLHESGKHYEIVQDIPLAESPEQNTDDVVEVGLAIGTDEQNKIADFVETAFQLGGIDYHSRQNYKRENGGFIWLIACPWKAEHSGGKDFNTSSAVILYPTGKLIYECKHAHCDGLREWKELRARMEEKAGRRLQFGPTSELQLSPKSDAPSLSPMLRVVSTSDRYAISQAEIDRRLAEDEYPVIPLLEQTGPDWSDDVMYGICGDIIRKASEYCEAHPAGMYLDLLVAVGNIIGRGPYFNINQTRHYTTEFMARVGLTSESRKGTGRDVIDDILKMIQPKWFNERIMSGFGSAEAIINELRDPMGQQVRDKKSPTGFKDINVPGVADKRLCIREGELASVFQLAGKNESRADIVLRDGWDGKTLRNIVKGKSRDGVSNSAFCTEPHLSMSGDTTRAELLAKMPDGAADNGFGNRFLYCYVYRTKSCPNGGPILDWSKEVLQLYEAIEFARALKYVPLTKSAAKVWGRMYMDLDEPENRLPGLAGAMTARAAAHIRRLALIYALLDKSDVVETRHLQAGKRMWDYCQDSARYIFTGTTREQDRIDRFIQSNTPTTVSHIAQELFHKHKTVNWVENEVRALVARDAMNKSGVRKNGADISFQHQ